MEMKSFFHNNIFFWGAGGSREEALGKKTSQQTTHKNQDSLLNSGCKHISIDFSFESNLAYRNQ